MPKLKNLTGQKFGGLLVVSPAPSQNGNTRWNCKCPTCSKIYPVFTSALKQQQPQQCRDCYQRTATHNAQLYKGGQDSLQIWWQLRLKGRLCQKWRDSWPAFYKDTGPRPSKRHCLSRRDPTKQHSPENSFWDETKKNIVGRFLTFRATTLNLSGWAEELGISREYMRKLANEYNEDIGYILKMRGVDLSKY